MEGSSARALAGEAVRIESDEQKDAARALEMLHMQLISSVIDPYSWKWVLLLLHHTLEAFVVATQAEGETVPEPTAGEPLELGDRPAGRAHPGPTPELRVWAKALVGPAWTEELDRDLARMMTYRRAFLGRHPSRWTLGIAELPRIARSCLEVVGILGWNPGHIPWRRQRTVDLARVKHMASMKVLDALDRQYRGD